MSTDVKAIFDKLQNLLEDDAAQNARLPEPLRSELTLGLACDTLPGGTGEFGLTPTNPIPVNGPTGEVLYLSKLRTDPGWKGLFSAGRPVMFHRVRSEDGLRGPVDVYEVLSVDRRVRATLYLSLYHPRKSRRAPRGFTLARRFDTNNVTYGVNHFVAGFPAKLDAHIRNWHMEKLGIPLPVNQVRQAVNGSPMRPSVLTEDEQRRPDDAAFQMSEDGQKLIHAGQDPRFQGGGVGMGTDGIVRPSSATTRPPPLIFTSHSFTGELPVVAWAETRLELLTVQVARALRRGLLEIKGPRVAGYWYECVYLAHFFLFVALLRANFEGEPPQWLEKTGSKALPRLIKERFERETFLDITVADVVRAYQQRHGEYFGLMAALTTDATDAEISQYGAHLIHVFTGTADWQLGVPLLSMSNKVLVQMVTSVENLAAAMQTARR